MAGLDYNIDWSLHFKYDDNSPSKLSWNRVAVTSSGRIMRNVGDFCNSIDSYGYWVTSVNGISYKVHIILWVIYHGSYSSEYTIDHINGIKTDNRFENLRLVPRAVNNRNVAMKSHNTSGYTGITVYRGSYKSKITYNKKQYARYFSISKYGNDEALRLAIQYREQKLTELIAQGAEFTERHGR